ncbi:hypothetical protein NKI46_25600 [Mesorhizobium sp. M0615]|uniref:hypothetical protein n=1 Tax=Mesorhizobium sp. M0615 TaxID=2956971 RepID=UPI00333D39EB
MGNLEMETPRILALRAAIRELRKAQDSAIAGLSDENSAENRKALHDMADTLKALQSIQKEEQGILTRILKWLHVIP